LETKSFTKPSSIVTAKICTKSGKLAVEGLCDQYEGGDATRIEYFAKGTQPTEVCDIHVKATICTKTNKLATENCPSTLLKEKVYLNKTEIGKTDDTPYILPKGECTLHKAPTTPTIEEPVIPDDEADILEDQQTNPFIFDFLN
jgi:penicillin-binding protein 1A